MVFTGRSGINAHPRNAYFNSLIISTSQFLTKKKKLTQLEQKTITAQKKKFSIKKFFCKCDQVRRKLRIWSHLLKKSLMENFIFCAVYLHSNNNLKTIQQQQFHFRIYCFYYYYQNITSILYIFFLLRLPCYSPPEGLFPSFIYQRDKKLRR